MCHYEELTNDKDVKYDFEGSKCLMISSRGNKVREHRKVPFYC